MTFLDPHDGAPGPSHLGTGEVEALFHPLKEPGCAGTEPPYRYDLPERLYIELALKQQNVAGGLYRLRKNSVGTGFVIRARLQPGRNCRKMRSGLQPLLRLLCRFCLLFGVFQQPVQPGKCAVGAMVVSPALQRGVASDTNSSAP